MTLSHISVVTLAISDNRDRKRTVKKSCRMETKNLKKENGKTTCILAGRLLKSWHGRWLIKLTTEYHVVYCNVIQPHRAVN